MIIPSQVVIATFLPPVILTYCRFGFKSAFLAIPSCITEMPQDQDWHILCLFGGVANWEELPLSFSKNVYPQIARGLSRTYPLFSDSIRSSNFQVFFWFLLECHVSVIEYMVRLFKTGRWVTDACKRVVFISGVCWPFLDRKTWRHQTI